MIRYAILLLNMLGLFIYQLFVADGVTIKQVVPSDLKPGNEYSVELTITKGAIGGFAKLQQELPAGVTATSVESKGASFSFSGSAVKFIWTSLPGEAEFKINYKITVSANAPAGEKILAGKFFYVVDNVKQSVEVPAAKLTIGGATVAVNTVPESPAPSPAAPEPTAPAPVTPEPVVPETPVAATPEKAEKPAEAPAPVTAVQNEPVPAKTETPVTVTPAGNVTNSDATVLAPPGTTNGISCARKVTAIGGNDYSVELTINRGNISGFGKIQENLPPGFTASQGQNAGASFTFAEQKVKFVWVSFPSDAEFKVVYKITGSAAGSTAIDGSLSYIENDETKKINISSTPITGGGVAVVNTPNEQAPIPDKNLTTTEVPKPQTNVNYKVQICALRQTPVDATYFTTRFGFNKVDTEAHEGWTKYTVGGFNEYKDARDNREDVRVKGVVGPFVTAYNSGRRITVQEALMITSQKWYK